jgi:serine protease
VPKIFVVYWQFPRYGDPSGEQAILHNFYGGIGGSSWNNTDTQYYGPVGTFISNPTGQLAGEWVDKTHSIPKHLTGSSIASEALNAVAHFGYNFNAARTATSACGSRAAKAERRTSRLARGRSRSSRSGTMRSTAAPADASSAVRDELPPAGPETDLTIRGPALGGPSRFAHPTARSMVFVGR